MKNILPALFSCSILLLFAQDDAAMKKNAQLKQQNITTSTPAKVPPVVSARKTAVSLSATRDNFNIDTTGLINSTKLVDGDK